MLLYDHIMQTKHCQKPDCWWDTPPPHQLASLAALIRGAQFPDAEQHLNYLSISLSRCWSDQGPNL